MTNTSDMRPLRRCPLWVKILLVASISLNLVVAGVVGGKALRMREEGGRFERMTARIVAMLPEERREEGRAILTARTDEIRALGAERLAANRRVLEAMRAEPMETAALEAALRARREAMAKRVAVFHKGIAELAGTLSPAERAAFAAEIEQKLRRRGRWRGTGEEAGEDG